ncbi:hypothetical protein BC629DRAFT_1597356 [Irpex lacteus]|nr:hypothetical protein BC629DRAFT_1597356 [Irpex lacteus]
MASSSSKLSPLPSSSSAAARHITLDAALAFFGLQRRGSAQVFEGANAPALRWTVENGQIWASFPFTGGPVSTGSSAGNNPPPPAALLVPPGTAAPSPIPAVSSHGVPLTSSQHASPPRDEAVGTEPGLHSTAPSESPEGNSTNQTDWPNGYQRREIPLDNVINVPRNRRSQTKWATRSTGNRAHAESANGKAERRGCLGVLQCETCRSLKRPFTQPDSLKQQLIKNCTYARCRDPQLQHIQCDAYTLQWEAHTDGGVVLIWEHHGEHDHRQPPDARLSQEEQERVDAQVALRPDASAHQLRTGSLTPGSVPLGEISQKLADPRKARAALSKSRERLGLQPESHKGAAAFLKGVETLFEETIKEPFLIGSGLVRPAYICVQTDFMRQVLYDAVQDWLRAAAEGPDVGRHGSVTDGDNSFFSQGNVITTCMFNLTANQWALVLYTWMLHVDTDHYRIHFLQLNRDLIKAAGDKFDRRLLSGVFDFSAAQRLAHEQAFADAIIGTMSQWSMLGPKAQEAQRQELCEEARKHQKGCESHFRTSVKRVKQSHELVPPDQRESFHDLIATFLSSDTTCEEFDDAAHTMRKRFPKVNSWLSWWLSKQFASMIFPAKRSMSTALARELPNTSNPVENRHSQLHHGTGIHQEIIPGLHNLYLHVKALERETKSIIDGYATASTRIETKRPPRNVHFYENDGRAPDTVERLQATEASTSGTGKRRARGSNRSSGTKKQTVPTPPKNKATALKAEDDSRSLSLVDPSRAQLRRLQSYQWANNSCFIDVGLELWFEAYSRWTTEEQLSFLRDQAMLGSPLHSICLNFKNRASWIAAPGLPTKQPGAQVVSSSKGKTREVWYAEEDNIARGFDILDVSQRAVRHAVIEWAKSPNNQALETFRDGSASFGETRAVFKNAIMDKTTLRAKLQFAIRHRVLLNCTHGHDTSSYTTIPTPILPLCSHDNARAGLACGLDTVGLDDGVDIGRYLSHLLPRLQGSSVASYNSGERLCEIEPPTCAYPQCGQDTTLQAIRTEWPRVLHIVPEISHNNDPQSASINPSPVQFTIAFDIWSQRHDAAGYVNPASLEAEWGSQPAVSVRYELFGRLIFHEDRAHYTAQVIIGDRSYLYDDMVREGVLADIGPKEAILAPAAGVAMVLYHRVSESNVTEQDIEYLRNTPKDISHTVAKQQPIEISDNSDESSVGQPLAQIRKAVRKPKQTKSKLSTLALPLIALEPSFKVASNVPFSAYELSNPAESPPPPQQRRKQKKGVAAPKIALEQTTSCRSEQQALKA